MNIEVNNNLVKFVDLNNLDNNVLKKMLFLFNHLGYDFPDIDSLKSYLERGNFLNEDQSKVILELVGKQKTSPLYSQNTINEDMKKAKEMFGETYDWFVAGYLLPDGTLLDFSEVKEGGPYRRTLDHREIRRIFNDSLDKNDCMIRFVNEGAIRCQQYGFELSAPPTREQERILGRMISKNRGEIVCDIANESGKVVNSMNFPYGTSSSTIFSTINDYFERIKIDKNVVLKINEFNSHKQLSNEI